MSERIMIHKWSYLKNKIQQKWEKLTEEDLEEIESDRQQLVTKLQHRYGFSKEKVEKELNKWEDSFSEENRDEDIRR